MAWSKCFSLTAAGQQIHTGIFHLLKATVNSSLSASDKNPGGVSFLPLGI